MDPLIVAFTFALGACVGSFLNVVTMRLAFGKPPSGRSHCPHCKKTLRWWELIPVLSFFIVGGKCARCKKKLSVQYPLVELATGISFAALAVQLPPALGALWGLWYLYGAVIIALSMAILVFDYHHTIVPDLFVYPLGALTFAALFVSAEGAFVFPSDLALLSGPIVAAPLAALWSVSRGRWIGLGDAKLALPIGWLLGITAGFTALALAFWGGALVGAFLLGVSHFARKRGALTMKSEVPFAPFLILGAAAACATGINFFLIV